MYRYAKIMKLLSGTGTAVQKYRKELFGSSLEVTTCDAYSLMEMCRTEGMPNYAEYIKLDIHTRAKLRAQYVLSSMVKLVERHDEKQEEAVKKLNQKSAARHKKRPTARRGSRRGR
jgi:hypothetical protein